jgi:hypothetical protein
VVKLLAPLFLVHGVAVATPTGTDYEDAACKKAGGGPPGLLVNPISCEVGECCQILDNGYSIMPSKCAGGESVSVSYPGGCDGDAGPSYSVKEGECTESYGIYSVTNCGGPNYLRAAVPN